LFKKLLTTMLVLAIVVSAGTAFAGSMSYKVYGKMHTSLNILNDGDESAMGLTSNLSRFGVKGGFELNEDYTAIWQFENGFDGALGGGGILATRNTFVGVKANWGTLIAGVHDSPMKGVGRKVTFFKDQIGDFRSTTMGHDRRDANMLMYSNDFSENIDVQVAYMLDSNAPFVADGEKATTFSGALHYGADNIYAGFAYEMASAGNFSIVADAAESESTMRAAIRYNADQFALSGLYQGISNMAGIDGLSATTMGFEGMFKASDSFNLKASYFMADPNTDVDDDGWAQMAVGVDHPVTENFTFYVQYATMMNDDGAAMGLGGNGWGGAVTPTMDDAGMANNPTGISIGSWVTF